MRSEHPPGDKKHGRMYKELRKRETGPGYDKTGPEAAERKGHDAARGESVERSPVMEEFLNLSGVTCRHPQIEEVAEKGRLHGGLGDFVEPRIQANGLAGYAAKQHRSGMAELIEMAGVMAVKPLATPVNHNPQLTAPVKTVKPVKPMGAAAKKMGEALDRFLSRTRG